MKPIWIKVVFTALGGRPLGFWMIPGRLVAVPAEDVMAVVGAKMILVGSSSVVPGSTPVAVMLVGSFVVVCAVVGEGAVDPVSVAVGLVTVGAVGAVGAVAVPVVSVAVPVEGDVMPVAVAVVGNTPGGVVTVGSVPLVAGPVCTGGDAAVVVVSVVVGGDTIGGTGAVNGLVVAGTVALAGTVGGTTGGVTSGDVTDVVVVGVTSGSVTDVVVVGTTGGTTVGVVGTVALPPGLLPSVGKADVSEPITEVTMGGIMPCESVVVIVVGVVSAVVVGVVGVVGPMGVSVGLVPLPFDGGKVLTGTTVSDVTPVSVGAGSGTIVPVAGPEPGGGKMPAGMVVSADAGAVPTGLFGTLMTPGTSGEVGTGAAPAIDVVVVVVGVAPMGFGSAPVAALPVPVPSGEPTGGKIPPWEESVPVVLEELEGLVVPLFSGNGRGSGNTPAGA